MRIDEILSRATTLKNSEIFITNYYNKYNNSFENYPIYGSVNKGSIVFTVPEEYVTRVFFYTNNWECLVEGLNSTPSFSVLDYIGKDIPSQLDEVLTECGYIRHATYGRIMTPIPFEPLKGDLKYTQLMKELYKPNLGDVAKIDDLPQIKKILRESFDAVSSDILPTNELIEAIHRGTVWIYKVNNEIVTMYIYQVFGKKRYGALTYNKLSADYLYSLCTNANKDSIDRFDVKYHYGWINLENSQVLHTMKLEGTADRFDGIYNYVYQKEDKCDDG